VKYLHEICCDSHDHQCSSMKKIILIYKNKSSAESVYIASLLAITFFSGCSLFRAKFKKLYKEKDFYLYQSGFQDTTGIIKYNGVYKIQNDSSIGFLRFYPDGKVIVGSCYGMVKDVIADECFDNEKNISLNGYYMIRKDTLFLELTDNVPISIGVWVELWKINGDTLRSMFWFDRTMLHNRNFSKVPQPGERGVVNNFGKRMFQPLTLPDRIKKDW
jgi:hypothetical protein